MAQALIERSELDQELYDGLEGLSSSRRFSQVQLEVIYALAYTHVIQEQYRQALPIFAFLAQYGPTQRQYFYGLGLCLQMEERYGEAINIYSLCAALFPECVEATQRIAQCQIATGECDAARLTLNMLLRYAALSGNDGLSRTTQAMLSTIAPSQA